MGGITREHHYTVDLNKPLMRQNCGILLAEGDSNGDCFSFALMRGGTAVNPGKGATVTAFFIRQDRNTVYITGENTNITNNRVSVILPESCYACGRFSLAVKVEIDGEKTTVAILDGHVRTTQTDTWVDPGTVVPSLKELYEQIKAIEDDIAKKVQLKPEFANSIAECTDTSKLYVLPDNFIYAYMRKEVPGEPINLIDQAGYTDGIRLSTGTPGSTKDAEGYVTTGIIDLSAYESPMTIRTRGVNFSDAQSAITSYNASGTATAAGLISTYIANPDDHFTSVTADSGGNLTIKCMTSSSRSRIRICGKGNGADLVVTIDGVASEGTVSYGWANTGHAFVPADYEETIRNLDAAVVALKEQDTALQGRVAALEAKEDGSIPAYVLTEAAEVADKLLAVRNADSFVFGAFSDSHTTGSDASAAGVMHAGMGMDAINALTRLDMAANFGDVIVDRFTDAYKPGFLHVRRSFSEVIKAVPYIHMQGNHDELSTDTTEEARQKYYAYIGADNVGVVTDAGNRFRNYGYKDFTEHKLRVIYLNTADVSEGNVTTDVRVSDTQLNWLNTVALNLTDPEWGIIVLSHHPLNWYGLSNLLSALDVYKAKGTGAELIAHFHGHLHNFRAETLGSSNILTITIPNACFGRNNEYGTSASYSDEVHTLFGDPDNNGNQRQYNKTADSAQDTAFNVVCVDRLNRRIHCFNYGAGIDRVLSY